MYSPAAARRQATAATMAAPRPEPSSDNFILMLFPGASSSSATLILLVYARQEQTPMADYELQNPCTSIATTTVLVIAIVFLTQVTQLSDLVAMVMN